jgi:hypothetical protein
MLTEVSESPHDFVDLADLGPMVGESRRLVHYQPMDFSSWLVQIFNHRMDCNFNPPAISRWTKKCPGNVADSFCELPDFIRKKYSNIGRYPRHDNRYPPGHEHEYHACNAKCQCVSIATCERVFSIQNTTKKELRNRMSTSNLESMMRVAIEGSSVILMTF